MGISLLIVTHDAQGARSKRLLFKFGMAQLKRKPGRMLGSILTIALGLSILWTVAITIDTLNNAFYVHDKTMRGNVDFTVYNAESMTCWNEHKGYDIGQFQLSSNYLDAIRAVHGVTNVVSRRGQDNIIHVDANNYMDKGSPDTVLYEINATKPDERNIGIGEVIDCLESIGNPKNVVLEDLLITNAVDHPIVFTKSLSDEYGWTIGDGVKIAPLDPIKACATPAELAGIANHSVAASTVNQTIKNDPGRWITFTIVGLFSDGSETRQTPFAPDNSMTLTKPYAFTMFINKNDSDAYVYNDRDTTSYFMVSTDGNVKTSDIAAALANVNANYTVGVFDVTAFTNEYATSATDMARSILLVASMLGLVASAIFTQSVVEMNIDEQIKDIAILYTVGFKRSKVASIVLPQLLVIAGAGTGIGIGIGFFLSSLGLFDLNSIITLIAIDGQYTVQVDTPVVISLLSVAITIGAGFAFPLIYGIAPMRKLGNWEIEDMLDSERTRVDRKKQQFLLKKQSNRKNLKKSMTRLKLRQKVTTIIIPALLMVFGIFMIYYACVSMFPQGTFTVEGTQFEISMAVFGIGSVVFVISFLLFFDKIIVAFITGFSKVARFKSIGQLTNYIPKRVRATNTNRNARNMTNALVTSVAIITILMCLNSSIINRDSYMERDLLGGDIVVFYPIVPSTVVGNMMKLSGVDHASIVTHNIMQSWRYNHETIPSYFMMEADGKYGGVKNGYSENLNVIVIQNTTDFLATCPPSERTYTIVDPLFADVNSLVSGLETGTKSIVQESLARRLGKGTGDWIQIRMYGLSLDFEITGVAKYFPGCPLMAQTSKTGMDCTIIVSGAGLTSAINSEFENVDVMIKNKNTTSITSMTNETLDADLLGLSSGLLDVLGMKSILGSIAGVNAYSLRFSTFSSVVPDLSLSFNSSRIIYKTDMLNITDGSRYQLRNTRMYAYDPGIEMTMLAGGGSVVECDDWFTTQAFTVPGESSAGIHNETMTDILYGADHVMPGYSNPYPDPRKNITGTASYCVVNKYMTMFDTLDSINSVYENKVGDNIMMKFTIGGKTIMQNFTVLATIDTQYSHYIGDQTNQTAYRLSPRTVNYNWNKNLSDVHENIIETIDGEANVFFTTIDEFQFMEDIRTGLPFSVGANEMINHVYVDVKPGYSTADVVAQIQLDATSRGMNLSVVDIKGLLSSKSSLGSLHVRLSPGANESAVVESIKQWYINNKYTWADSYVATTTNYAPEQFTWLKAIEIVEFISIFTMFTSQIGLVIIVHMIIKKQSRDFGVLKAMGFSNQSLERMVLVETSISNASGILIGLLIGLGIMWMFATFVSIPLFIPIHMIIPFDQIALVVGVSFVGTFIASFLNAKHMLSVPIEENIRPVG